MEWYYDYATGQLHNGIGWNYDLSQDKLVNNGQASETLDHITKLGDTTYETYDGSNAAFVAAKGKITNSTRDQMPRSRRTFSTTHRP